LDSECRSINNPKYVYRDCAKRINILEDDGREFLIITPVYFSDDNSVIASYCYFKFTKQRMYEATKHIVIVSISLLLVMGIVLIANILIYNVSQRSFISKIVSMIKNQSITKGSEAMSVIDSSPSELKPILDELIDMSNNVYASSQKIKEYEVAAAIGRAVAMIAHDMRSPLSVLKTYADLKTSACDDQDVEKLRQSAERSVGKLGHMAEDLVDYAKASKLQRAKHQLSGIIYEGSIAEAKKRAEDKGVKIVSAIQGGILVDVDAYKLERVITNLVNNAVQAIENGEVSIAATTEHNGVLKITVKDDGKGIDPETLPHIFDSFFTKGKRGGSGLGLAYCKQVIEAHGGTIDVESELGKGTTFTICIPNCAVEHAHAAACHSRESGNPETSTPGSSIKALGDDVLMDPGSKPAPAGGKPGAWMTITDKQILIADDDPEIRAQWQQIIPERGGTVVHSAKTVKEVEEAKIDYSKIDTAIVDYQFYGEDKTGIDLIKHLKTKGVKTVYLCTGFYDNEMIINQAHAAGAVRVLPKPIDPSLLS